MWKLKRTNTCGELRAAQEGREVILNGWVDTVRDYGGMVFIDLRDRYGRTQVVAKGDLVAAAKSLSLESVLGVRGIVLKREVKTVNKKIPTGEVEVEAKEIEVLNAAKTPPFEVRDNVTVNDELRFKYRYLDLRRPKVQAGFMLRAAITAAIHESMHASGFIEIETPYMIKSTPGGARNFLIPSRLYPGLFFGLSESPQIFKQLFMVSGFDKYYQIARCFRDEDLRADRQLEFTQLDLEMSFVQSEDVMNAVEACVAHVFKQALGVEVARPFPRLSYEEAMLKYGSDKPDLRFGMPLTDITKEAAASEFRIFKEVVAKGGAVRALRAEGQGALSRKQVDELETFAKGVGAKGLLTLKVEATGEVAGSFAKQVGAATASAIAAATGAKPGDMIFAVADEAEVAASALGALRVHLWQMSLKERPKEFKLCWVHEFPLFETSAEGDVVSKHHVFTSPRDEDLARLESDPLSVKAKAYDLVLNGVELGGGSIRIHRRDIQNRIFKIIGLTEAEALEKFGFMLEAFEYGAPPHGGIALGLDRFAMLLGGVDSIRDVVAFPKTQRTTCPMTGAPAAVTEKQLKELHVRVVE